MRKTRGARGVSPHEHAVTGAMSVQGANAPRSPRANARPGLTLLELMLVVFILSMVAFSAVSLTNTLDEQSRYESTRDRIEMLRVAIAGRPGSNVGNHLIVEGFVADVGRLPTSLDELVNGSGMAPWQSHPESGQSAGWRGPYLNRGAVNPAAGFVDGWGLPWKLVEFDNGTEKRVRIQSFGSDGQADEAGGGTSAFELDYPPGAPWLLNRHDHHLELNDYAVRVRFTAPAAGSSDATTVRLRLYYPTGLPENDPPTPVMAFHESDEFSVPSLSASGTTEVEHVFQIDGMVPWGVRTFRMRAGSDFVGPTYPITLLPRTQPVPMTIVHQMPSS